MNVSNLHFGLSIHATNKPDEIAFIYNDRTLTYKQLYERVCRLANALSDNGVKKGDHIALYMKNRIEMAEILYAISMIGGVAVPVNYMVEGSMLKRLIDSSDSTHIFVEQEQVSKFEKIMNQLDSISEENIILIGDQNQSTGNCISYEQLISKGVTEDPKKEVYSEDVAAILYSSGTTSLPKGIVVTHGQIMDRVLRTALEWNVNYRDNILVTVPIYHSVGHLYTFYVSALGCKLVITRDFNPEETLKIIQNQKITHSFFVPTQYTTMLQEPAINNVDLSSLKLLVSAAAPLAEATKKEIIEKFKCNLTEFLGTTETALLTSLRPEEVLRKTASVGQHVDFAKIRLVDEQGNDVNPGEDGEFVFRGSALFKEYYKMPEETNKSFFPGGWHRTGDMGRMDEEGFYYILDRKKDMIISGGVNIYSKDIEEVIFTHVSVLEAAVIGVPDEKWGEAVKAYVVLKRNQSISQHELIDYCNGKLSKFQRMKNMEFIDSLPRNPSGKILKRELRDK
jgi:acyl-CoA synthetase (AMP-forming)/AMP-acid ligase II